MFEGLGVPFPYRCLYENLPGFNGLRVPARFAILVVLALAVLAAFGVVRLTRAIRRAWGDAAVSSALAGIILLESFAAPIPLGHMPTEVPAVYRWLADQVGEGAVVELPFPDPPDAYWEARRLYYSTVHWRPLVNGYSGYFPPEYWEQAARLRAFPAPEAVALLRALGVRYVLLHPAPDRAWWERAMTALDTLPAGLAVAARFPDAVAVEVWPPR